LGSDDFDTVIETFETETKDISFIDKLLTPQDDVS